jgi:hypothetical protein
MRDEGCFPSGPRVDWTLSSSHGCSSRLGLSNQCVMKALCRPHSAGDLRRWFWKQFGLEPFHSLEKPWPNLLFMR